MRIQSILLALLAFYLAACSGEATTATEAQQATTAPDSPSPSPSPAPLEGQTRYSWVDNLNLRAEPTTSGKVVGKLSTTVPLTLTGKVTPNDQAVVLRGGLYIEPWYEVKTEEDRTGWVFGGAIKGEHESKGNRLMTTTDFNYPHFGQFDLTRWEEEEIEQPFDEESDVQGTLKAYRGDGQRMTIEVSESEYGYGTTHLLYNLKGDLLKSRKIYYDNQGGEFIEEVTDLMDPEPKVYRRAELAPVSYQQLNARPVFVQGEWGEFADDQAVLN